MSAAAAAHHVQSIPAEVAKGDWKNKPKVQTKLVPQSVSPVKNTELTLETAKGIRDPVVIIVKNAKFQATLTVARPIGSTAIPKDQSYIYAIATDLALVNTENPYEPAAVKAFEKACIDAYIEAEGFHVADGKVYYCNVDATDKSPLLDFSRAEHIAYAKEKCEAAKKSAKKAHDEAEKLAGRTGQMRPDKTRAPKPHDFDSSGFKWINYLDGEYHSLEKAYEEFKKGPAVDHARAAKKATLAKHVTRLGVGADVEQKEARRLRGVTPSSAPSRIVKIIMEALASIDPDEAEHIAILGAKLEVHDEAEEEDEAPGA